MGRRAGIYVSDKLVRSVFLEGGRWGYTLKEVREGLPAPGKLAGYSVHLACLHTEVVLETLQIPPVRDERTREILLKKHLSEVAGVSGDLLITYREIGSDTEAVRYRIFGIPSELYFRNPLVPEWLREKLDLFTLPQFAVAQISSELFADETVFHVYADESALLMVVSRGNEVIYTRSLPIPPYAVGEDFLSFLQENVSVTFLFVVQRQSTPVDVILLSGRACEGKLAEDLLDRVSVGIATPVVPPVFGGVSPEVFHRYLPAFGTALTELYDFSPPEVRERRRSEGFLKRVTVFLALLLLLCIGGVGFRIYTLMEEMETLRELRTAVARRSGDLSGDPLLREGLLSYYLNYVNLLNEVQRRNPLNLLSASSELIAQKGVKRCVFGRREDKLVLLLKVEREFPRLSELVFFREKILSTLKDIEKSGVSYRIEREFRDLKENRLGMEILLERSL